MDNPKGDPLPATPQPPAARGEAPFTPGVRGQEPAALLTQLPAERVAQDPWVTGTGCLQSNVPLIFICYFFFSFFLLAGTADF